MIMSTLIPAIVPPLFLLLLLWETLGVSAEPLLQVRIYGRLGLDWSTSCGRCAGIRCIAEYGLELSFVFRQSTMDVDLEGVQCGFGFCQACHDRGFRALFLVD